jgi:alkylation response protein AidB-like acyl-CoA dehydrogenase
MRFHLSDEQEMLCDSLRGTLSRVAPVEHCRSAVDGESDFDTDAWRAVMEWGLGSLLVSEEDGGSGACLLNTALAMELLGECAAPGPYLGHMLASLALTRCGDAALKAQWLPSIAAGTTIATVATTGDWMPDTWSAEIAQGRVTGTSAYVLGAGHADIFIVGTVGRTLALVEADAPGISIMAVETSDRTRRLYHVAFDQTPCHVIGGHYSAQRMSDAGLILLSSDALGGANKALAMSVEYAKIREQFGVPIGSFQAVKHQLASMALLVEPARALCWYAAHAFDQNQSDQHRTAALAKAHLADRFTAVTRAAIQIHGGIGYTWEHEMQIYFRRALFDHAYLGLPSLHRERAAVLAGW